jgi:hypothetical protein
LFINHGLGYGAKLEKIARFKKLNISAVFFKTAHLFRGNLEKQNRSKIPKIYGFCIEDIKTK